MSYKDIITNIYLWMGTTIFFVIAFVIMFIFIFILAKKTHAIVEFKAWIKGIPIAMFFQENRYVEWVPILPDAGIIESKDYGSFIVNERATYVDKRTKNVIIPFDAAFAGSVNVHAAKLADDIQYLVKDDEQMKLLRHGIATGILDESINIDGLKTSINFGAIKTMLTAMIPHNISAKIEKVIAARLKGHGKINVPQVIMLFVSIFGAIVLGGFIVYTMLK